MLRTVHIRVIADISFDGVPRRKVVVLPDVENFNLIVSDGGPGYKMVAHISCPSAKRTSLTHKKEAEDVIPEEIFPASGSWDALVCKYSRSPVEKVAYEISAIPNIMCKLTFLSPGPNVIELCFRVVDEDDEEYFDLPSVEMRNEVFTQAARTARNHPRLANLKRLCTRQSPLSVGSTDIPYLASEVNQLFKSVGSLDELTISHCDLAPRVPTP